MTAHDASAPMSTGTRLTGKRALVTGAAQGLGVAIARALAAEGALVLLTDINGAGAERQAAAINHERGATVAFARAHDVTSEAQWAEALADAEARLGGLSVLVNNAGIGTTGPLEATSLADWRRMFAVNVESVFLGCKLAMPLLRRSQPASIVNISSIAGLIAGRGMVSYNAAKAAVWMLSKAVAMEAAGEGADIRSNSVHPAFVDTAILDNFNQHGAERDDVLAKLARGLPAKRIGEPREIAAAVVYLASDESRFMTGAEVKLDGGLSAM